MINVKSSNVVTADFSVRLESSVMTAISNPVTGVMIIVDLNVEMGN